MRQIVHRIRERSALIRQLQQFFHMYLVGVWRWDQARHYPPIPVERPVYNHAMKRADREVARDGRKFRDIVAMQIGPFELSVKGPYEDDQHPCGLIRVSRGEMFVEGPLDETTWKRVGDFIKQKEENHGDPSPAESSRHDQPHDLGARAPWGC